MEFIFRSFDLMRVYLDDVLIHSATVLDHAKHLLEVIKVISKHGLNVKIGKCSFVQSRVRLLFHCGLVGAHCVT